MKMKSFCNYKASNHSFDYCYCYLLLLSLTLPLSVLCTFKGNKKYSTITSLSSLSLLLSFSSSVIVISTPFYIFKINEKLYCQNFITTTISVIVIITNYITIIISIVCLYYYYHDR